MNHFVFEKLGHTPTEYVLLFIIVLAATGTVADPYGRYLVRTLEAYSQYD
jgi:hypothetical protein